MTPEDRKCVLCRRTDRDGNPCEPNWAMPGTQTCEGHRARIERLLEVVPVQWSWLSAAPGSGNGQARVSGTAEQSLGVSVSALDLIGPANTGSVHDPYRDQVGMVSVASILDSWCSDWAELRGKGESRPLPTVARLSEWLIDRLGWAVEELKLDKDGNRIGGGHPALADFGADMSRTLAALKVANGDVEQEDDHKAGIECPKCDRMTLFDTGEFIECAPDAGGCGKLLKPSEYARWVEMKDYFLRASTPCPDCGTEALAGASRLDKVECLRAKDGCGYRMSWRQYEEWAITVHRPERVDHQQAA